MLSEHLSKRIQFQWTWANCHSIQQRAAVHTLLYRGISTSGLNKPAFWTWKILFLPLSNYSRAGYSPTPTPPPSCANTHRIQIKVSLKNFSCSVEKSQLIRLFFRNAESLTWKNLIKKPHMGDLFLKTIVLWYIYTDFLIF